jgi:hypothetical protein
VVCVATIAAAGRVTTLPVGAYLRGRAAAVAVRPDVAGRRRGRARARRGGAPLLASLAAQIAAGAIVYVAAAFVLVRPAVDELIRVARAAIRRR